MPCKAREFFSVREQKKCMQLLTVCKWSSSFSCSSCPPTSSFRTRLTLDFAKSCLELKLPNLKSNPKSQMVPSQQARGQRFRPPAGHEPRTCNSLYRLRSCIWPAACPAPESFLSSTCHVEKVHRLFHFKQNEPTIHMELRKTMRGMLYVTKVPHLN